MGISWPRERTKLKTVNGNSTRKGHLSDLILFHRLRSLSYQEFCLISKLIARYHRFEQEKQLSLKMGSYLSICNNTKDDWYVKVGSDQAASKIATYVGVGALALGTAGMAAGALGPFIAAGAYFGIGEGAAAAIMAVTTAASTAGAVGFVGGAWAATVGGIIQKTWKDDGFVCIKPGTKHRWGKMTPSLWQQAECRRFRQAGDSEAKVAKLYMRPIFSHSLSGNDYVYYIQTWLNKPNVNFQEMEINNAYTLNFSHFKSENIQLFQLL